MENPFFGGFWDRHPETRTYRRPHYYYPNPYSVTTNATPVKSESDYQSAPKIKPKSVVSIPVNFVNSDAAKSQPAAAKKAAVKIRMDKTTAAVKIQAAFRGFCVRKPEPLKKLRVIMKTKAEAAEIRRRITERGVVDLIRRDEKERLKITECIMSLLLRLDAIQGVNSFVRELRKTVTRELVNLQETVDDITAGKSMQEMATEDSISSEAEEECPNVEENVRLDCLQRNFNEEIKDKELLGLGKEAAVNGAEAEQNEMREEESLPSHIQDLQIETSLENEEGNSDGLETLEQRFPDAKQIVSGPEECITVDGAGEDAEFSKENKFESPVLEPDTSHGILCTEENVKIVNSRDGGRSSEALDLLKVETIQSDGNLEADDNMDCEEEADKLPKKEEEGIEDIGLVREENERLKRTVSDLLKKSEKQSETINNLSLRISQLEEQVSQCSKKKKIGDGKKQSSTSTENDKRRRRKMNGHLKNCFKEDWF